MATATKVGEKQNETLLSGNDLCTLFAVDRCIAFTVYFIYLLLNEIVLF